MHNLIQCPNMILLEHTYTQSDPQTLHLIYWASFLSLGGLATGADTDLVTLAGAPAGAP